MTTTTPSILGLGNALVDIIIQLENDQLLDKFQLPKGSMQLVDKAKADSILDYFKDTPQTLASGGSASNTIHGLANLGVKTGFIGMVGKDHYGDFFIEDAQENGICPEIFRGDIGSGTAITLMSPDSERTFATYLGSAVQLSAEHLKKELFEGFQYLHVEGYLVQNYPLVERAMQLAKACGLQVSLDMASYNVVEEHLDFLKKILREYVDIVFANEEEAKAFTDLSPEESLNILAELCDYAVVKTGSKGSIAKHKEQTEHIGIMSPDCIDTNGAGDGYAAGFLYGLIHGFSLKNAGQLGAIVAGHVIQYVGPKLNRAEWDIIIDKKKIFH